jgi:magnesium transporter
VPVLESDGRVVGFVTVDDVIDVTIEEGTEDALKMGAVEPGALDAPYASAPFWSLIRKRAGWLLVLFLGEMLTATGMGRFEDEIARAVVLALFVPLIISSGGNSGSQAASLIIRAMAVGELGVRDWWHTVWLSLLGVVLWGTLTGSMLPLMLKRMGLDPAVSSAPFVATLVDVTGIVIYFEVAAHLLRGTLL